MNGDRDEWPRLSVLDLDEAERDDVVERERGERLARRRGRDGEAEQEEAQERREATLRREPTVVDRDLAALDQRSAEQLRRARRPVAGVVEDVAEPPDEAGVVRARGRRGYAFWRSMIVEVLLSGWVNSSFVQRSVNVSMCSVVGSPPSWSRYDETRQFVIL